MTMGTTVTERGLPSHLAVLVGISAGAYAVSLAGVTALQSAADARVIAEREPIRLAAEAAAADHQALETALRQAADRYGALAARYDGAGGGMADLEGSLDDLAARAAALTESAASLSAPARVSLPRVQSAPRVKTSAPKTHSTTRASGG
jgi:hypothetical protein